MNYLTALKTARDHFGMDAVAIMSEDRCPVSELIEAAETSPTASGSSGFEVRIRTDQQVTTSVGTQIPAWAIYDELPATGANGEDEEAEPLLKVVSGEDLSR